MYRLDFPYVKPYIDALGEHPKLDRIPSEVLTQNLWYNCSGNFFTPALLACLHAVRADRTNRSKSRHQTTSDSSYAGR